MKLKQIKEKIFNFIEENPEVYDNDEGQTEEVWDEFNKLQDKIFNDNQTYFQWEVDNDTFEIDSAFDSVLDYLKDKGKKLKDFVMGYDSEDHFYIFIETED